MNVIQQKKLEVPYKGKMLSGASLHQKLDEWSDYGTIEPDAAQALKNVSENARWWDLFRPILCFDRYWLGNGSLIQRSLHMVEMLSLLIFQDQKFREKLITKAKILQVLSTFLFPKRQGVL
eukprot:TRINITY_DN3672_c1_g1_i1.p1 TRINITY_DN3672_c1_g1~~TRINITY_DN3672_c1_g1_i1.p1  ORF type:complete len:121 (+),score=15.24 TRINITY_DN3672_c1_g1_i1:423-785(+)